MQAQATQPLVVLLILGGSLFAFPALGLRTLAAAVAMRGTMQLTKNPAKYTFTLVTSPMKTAPTFLGGINNAGVVAAVSGNGTFNFPFRSFLVVPPYKTTNFRSQNYPGAAGTIANYINNKNNTCGYYQDSMGYEYGYVRVGGKYKNFSHPEANYVSPFSDMVQHYTEFIGMNDKEVVTGLYLGRDGKPHGFMWDYHSGKLKAIAPPKSTSSGGTSINNAGVVTGTAGTGSFLLFKDYTQFSVPKTQSTYLSFINNKQQVVGKYVETSKLGEGQTHGFVGTVSGRNITYQLLDVPEPQGKVFWGSVNDKGVVAGYVLTTDGGAIGLIAKKATKA